METPTNQDLLMFTRGNPDTDALPLDDIITCATDIFDDNASVEMFGHGVSHDSASRIGRSAGGEGDNHCDRTSRIGLGVSD